MRSELGLGPWDVFHEGVADRLDVRIGSVIVVVGVVTACTYRTPNAAWPRPSEPTPSYRSTPATTPPERLQVRSPPPSNRSPDDTTHNEPDEPEQETARSQA